MESLQKRWNDWISSFKKKDASGGDEKANIKSAEIVYVFGPSGAGKTFSGDYMTVVHGYHHVDGDIPNKHMTLMVPEYKEMIEKWFIDGDWAPFFSELARLTLEAAKEHKKVVLSHATPGNEQRDHVVKKLVEGGARKDKRLLSSSSQLIRKAHGLYHRTKRMAKQAGMTLTDLCRANLGWDGEGEVTEEIFVELALQMEVQHKVSFADHPEAIMVDISGRDVTHFDNLDKALGLTRSSDLTYEGICAEVKPIDAARDAKTMGSGLLDASAEIMARAAAKRGDNSLVIDEEGEDEKKVEEMKKRRSSLVQLERSMRDLSVGDTSEEVRKSRKSLIKTGKIDEE